MTGHPLSTCRDILESDGRLQLTCQGCRNRSFLTGTQACALFGDDAGVDQIRPRLKCSHCGKRGRTDALWFRLDFIAPTPAR